MEIELGTPAQRKITTRSVTGFVLLLLMAAVFFYSAYSKIHSDNAFDNFQWTFIDMGINSFMTAGIIARLMIGFEFMLGLFLVLQISLSRFTYKAILLLLAIFNIYLFFVLMKQGNKGDCGCFGDKLAMPPLAALIKNFVMMAVTVLLMKIYPGKPYKGSEYVFMLLAVLTILVPFHTDLKDYIDVAFLPIVIMILVLSAVIIGYHKDRRYRKFLFIFVVMLALFTPFRINPLYTGTAPVPFSKPMDLSLLYKFDPKPDVDLTKGKHIVAFMSLTCPHCKKAAYLMQIIHKQHPDYPLYMVLDGAEVFKKQFFDETHAEDVPHMLYYHTNEFSRMAGNDGVPAIYWINNGVVEYKSKYAYYQLDPQFMGEWVKN